LEGTSGGHLVQHPAQIGPPKPGFPGPCPHGFGVSPSRETPQPPLATCASAHSKKVFSDVQMECLVFQFVPIAF